MKYFRIIIALLVFSVILLACKKEYSTENGEQSGTIEEDWQFSISDVISSGPMDSGYVQSVGSVSTLTLVGSTANDKQGEIFLQIVGEEISTGTFTNPLVFFQYSEGGNVVYQSSPVQTGGFSIVITNLDSTSVEGTFSGTILDAQGNALTLNEGKFETKITGWENTPEPVLDGQLTVWTRQICVDGSPIELRIAEQTAQLVDGLAAEPGCAAEGAAVFSLQAGTYTLQAICGTDTIPYEVEISEACTILEIDLQNPPENDDYLPLTIGSYWDYNGLNDASTTQRITSDGNDSFDGRMYTRLISSTGDTFYYRKQQGVYYQYRTLDFQGYVDNPPSIEIVILYDDMEEGQTWESPGEDIVYSSIPVKVV